MSPRLKATLVGAALFLTGSLTGAFATRAHDLRTLRDWIQAPVGPRRTQLISFALDHRLDLDASQREQLEQVLERQERSVEDTYDSQAPQRAALRRQLVEECRAFLRPEQLSELQSIVSRTEARDASRVP